MYKPFPNGDPQSPQMRESDKSDPPAPYTNLCTQNPRLGWTFRKNFL